MPELPEVETIVRELKESSLIGKQIISSSIFWDRTIAEPSVPVFSSQIKGQSIKKITRRGKWIVIVLSEDTLLIHLRMTGQIQISKEVKLLDYERVRLSLSDGRFFHYVDPRKFGKWHLVKDTTQKFSSLGIEPLSDNYLFDDFQALLKKSSVGIKAFLLNQRHIVGIGNIYADEALFKAKIHPTRKANSLTSKETKSLFQAIPEILAMGIENRGTSLGNNKGNYKTVKGFSGGHLPTLSVFRKENTPCPICKTLIVKIVVAQRGTHICPHCQTLKEQK